MGVSDDLVQGFVAHAEKLARIHLRCATFKVEEVPNGSHSRWDRVKNHDNFDAPAGVI